MKEKNTKKILGLITLTISAAVSTVVSNYMMEKSIKSEVADQLAQNNQEEA